MALIRTRGSSSSRASTSGSTAFACFSLPSASAASLRISEEGLSSSLMSVSTAVSDPVSPRARAACRRTLELASDRAWTRWSVAIGFLERPSL